jgi:hypothetical protein
MTAPRRGGSPPAISGTAPRPTPTHPLASHLVDEVNRDASLSRFRPTSPAPQRPLLALVRSA